MRPLQLLWVAGAAAVPGQPKRECWFLHGAGEVCVDAHGHELPNCTEPSTTPDMMDGERYWGDFGGSVAMPECASFHYNHEDTVYQRFDAPALRRRVCASLCGGPGCVITDKVIFTHSAANNYLAAAIDQGDCFLGGSSDWFLANAPALGSKAADFAHSVCSNTNEALRPLTSMIHYCTDRSGAHAAAAAANPMYRSMGTDYDYRGSPLKAGALRDVMAAHASGGLCGIYPDGQSCPHHHKITCEEHDVGLCLLSKLAFAKPKTPLLCPDGLVAHCKTDKPCGIVETDGMVGLSSCQMPGKEYSSSPASRWYTNKGNHEDGTCINGDRPGADQQPCSWYQHVVRSSAEEVRGARYSCRGDGQKGCKRDPHGDHDSETSCLETCASCEAQPGVVCDRSWATTPEVVAGGAGAVLVVGAAAAGFVRWRRGRGGTDYGGRVSLLGATESSTARLAGSE